MERPSSGNRRQTPSRGHVASAPRALADCASFAQLAQRAQALEALDRALRQTLPLPLREQVRFADLREQRLVFVASSPAWASRLRLAQGGILASARAIGVAASAIKVKVVPPDAAPTPMAATRTPLSPGAARHLRAAAGGFEDAELRALFLALAAQAGTRSS